MLDFFKPRTGADLAVGNGSSKGGVLKAKRKSEDALSEIHVNRGGPHAKQLRRAGELSDQILFVFASMQTFHGCPTNCCAYSNVLARCRPKSIPHCGLSFLLRAFSCSRPKHLSDPVSNFPMPFFLRAAMSDRQVRMRKHSCSW